MKLFGLFVPKMYLWKKYFSNWSKLCVILHFKDASTGILNILKLFWFVRTGNISVMYKTTQLFSEKDSL